MAYDLTGKERERICEIVGQGSWPTSAGSYGLQELSKEREAFKEPAVRASPGRRGLSHQGQGHGPRNALEQRDLEREKTVSVWLCPPPPPTGVVRGILVSVVDEKILNHISRKSFKYLTFSASPDISRACFAPSFASTGVGRSTSQGKKAEVWGDEPLRTPGSAIKPST